MWVLKKNLLGLALVVGAVCASYASEPTYEIDVKPFKFNAKANGQTDSDWQNQQLEKWKRLMKYKLFATGVSSEGINFVGQNIHITDSVGYVGSATGNFKMGGNSNHSIGGPLMFGGSFSNETGTDSILTGPTRFNGTFNASNNGAGNNYFAGKNCASSYNGYTSTGVSNAHGSISTSNAGFCTDTKQVYAVDSDLDIPTPDYSSELMHRINAISGNGGTVYIHVPANPDGDSSAYNIVIPSIHLQNNAKLHVVMPPNGRLTKIYVEGSITGIGSTSGEIVVVYAKGATWNGSAWVGFSDTPLANSDYAGNLLFYTPNDLSMGAADKTLQGSYLSSGVITISQHTHFAGQLLGKVIRINADFDAKDFKYVPFNPPQIGLNMAANQILSEADVVGGYTGSSLDISLTKAPTTDVTFKYCFEFNGTVASGSTLANINDVCTTSGQSGCTGYISLPICGADTASARIPKDSLKTETPIKIWINDDGVAENREFFTLQIFNLTGGVFSDNSREWPVSMQIIDNDNTTPCNIVGANNSVTVPEDAVLNLNGFFPAQCSDGTGTAYNVLITGLPGKGTLKLNGSDVTSLPAGGLSVSSGNLGNLTFVPALNQSGSPYTTISFKINDPAEGVTAPASGNYTLTINVTPVNDAPTAKGCNKTINENVAKNTNVCKVEGHDVDSTTLKSPDEKWALIYHIIYGNVGNVFKINTSTGQIQVNGTLDYEALANPVYPLLVSVSDGKDSVVVNVNVTINNVNEKPVAAGFDTTVVENGGIGQFIGQIKASDPEDGRNSLTYSIISGDPNGVFEIRKEYVQGDTFALVYTKKNIDYEALASQDYKYTLSVKVSDKDGKDTTVTAIVRVTNENESPVVQNDTCEIEENTTTWTKGCQITATDPEKKTMTYTIAEGNASSLFEINASSGEISVTGAPNYEDGSLYLLGVDVSDGVHTVRAWALVNVIDVNEPPTATVRNGTIQENATAGTPVDCVVNGVLYHCVEGSDEDAGSALTYSIVGGNPDNLFNVTPDGNIVVTKDYAIDYETDSSYVLTIRICDNGKPGNTPSCIELPSTITVIDGNELPTASGFTVTIRENAPVDSVVGTVTGSDPEGDTLTFSFGSGNNGKAFSIDAKTGKVKVARQIDFEALTKTTFEIQVFVNDGHNRIETLVKITIKDINEGAEIDDATMTVAENQPKGTTVGTLELYDPDQNENFRKNTFTAIGGDKTKFTIDANTGVIKTNDVFDYETQKTYTLVVQVKDPDGNADTATVTINISDVKETSKIVVTYAETGSGSQNWTNPTGTLYTNENTVLIQWTADGKDMCEGERLDSCWHKNLHEGFNVVTLTYKDPTKNSGVTETVGIFVSTRTPEVTVTTAAEHDNSGNIFTLVETPAEGDTSVYVNKKNNDIVVTVKEPVLDESYTDSTCNYETRSFTVNAELEPVTIPSNTYEAINNVMKAAPVLNENPISEVTYSQYNGDQVKVSYTEKVAGVDVVISYVTDKNGNVEKIPVIGANGKIDSIEVITVSYQVNVGGKTVNVSYMADAATGQALKTTTVNSGSTGTANAGTTNSGSNAGTNSGSNGGKPGSSNGGSNGGTNSSSNGGANGGSNAGTNSGSNGGSGSEIGNAAPVYAYSLTEGEVLFSVTYDYATKAKGVGETTVQVSYTVDQKGKVTKDKDGNVGYEVSYTYVNEMGNSSTQSVYIVVDLIPPTVKILSPEDQAVLHSNMVEVQWCVDLGDGRGCQIQDSLTVEGLQPGEINEIVRFYRDKAGNEASAVVYVMAKNTKDVDITVEKPVTNITKEDVDKYYASKKPEEGQTFAVSIYNPQADKEIETQVGGSFKNKAAKPGEEVYPGLTDHLGPTLGIETKVPVINSVGGLATLDDLVGSDGLILLDAVDAVGSKKVTVEEFVEEHCSADFKSDLGSDISKANIYDTKMSAKIWIYTSLGQFVDYFSFTQDLNDPSYASDAGVLTLYFEMKPDENGDLHTDNGRLYATGAYVYKTEFTMKSTLRCDLPPFDEATNVNKMNQSKKVTEDLLKSFGYKRPKSK